MPGADASTVCQPRLRDLRDWQDQQARSLLMRALGAWPAVEMHHWLWIPPFEPEADLRRLIGAHFAALNSESVAWPEICKSKNQLAVLHSLLGWASVPHSLTSSLLGRLEAA